MAAAELGPGFGVGGTDGAGGTVAGGLGDSLAVGGTAFGGTDFGCVWAKLPLLSCAGGLASGGLADGGIARGALGLEGAELVRFGVALSIEPPPSPKMFTAPGGGLKRFGSPAGLS
jgi:hypothetical protein